MSVIRKGNSYCGYIDVGERKYFYEIDCSKEPNLFSVDWKLKLLLGSSVNQFLEESTFNDPKEFHSRFSEFVKTRLKTEEKTDGWIENPLKMYNFVKNLKEEIENFGELIKHIDLETGVFEVEVTDSQLRNHKATIKLSQNYPREPIEVVSHDLPLQGPDLVEGNTDLHNIYSISEFCKKFSQLVNNFQDFWNAVSLLDLQCWVWDPPNPTYKDIQRRIKLTDTLSVVLTLNPFNPKQRPNIKILGCQSDVNHYKSILQRNLENEVWDCDEDLPYNLSNVLEINLLEKSCIEESKGEDQLLDAGECAICFTWRLDDEVPNEVCGKPSCKSMYHSTCLFKYLSSIPKNRDYFGKIQGECPNCDEIISCSVPKFR